MSDKVNAPAVSQLAKAKRLVRKFMNSANDFGPDEDYPEPYMYDLTERDRRKLERMIAEALNEKGLPNAKRKRKSR